MSDTDAIELSGLPRQVREHLQGRSPVPAPLPDPSHFESPVIHMESLRRVIRSTDVHAMAHDREPCRFPAHIDYARKQYLAALIDVFNGDLPVIGQFFDRGSEKTLRNLIRAFGLESALQTARSRARRSL